MDRKQTVVELMKDYLDMEDDNPNKKEIKSFLIDEMKLQYQLTEQPTDYLLRSWIDNALRTDLEERLKKEFGIKDKPLKEEYITSIPVLKSKK